MAAAQGIEPSTSPVVKAVPGIEILLEHDGHKSNRRPLDHLAPLLSAEARLRAKADAGRGRIAEQSG
jgi:hypothetical protein